MQAPVMHVVRDVLLRPSSWLSSYATGWFQCPLQHCLLYTPESSSLASVASSTHSPIRYPLQNMQNYEKQIRCHTTGITATWNSTGSNELQHRARSANKINGYHLQNAHA